MSPELINVIFQVSRWLFAFLGALAVLSALGWLHAEKKARRVMLRSAPAAGTVGELMVLSGSDELPVQTWFPVSREGVLGSVRSCDLVVPCPGVKAHHLDFCWKDGVGLIIRPRSGCEAVIDGVRLDCRSDVLAHPLTHGACLQVGQAVLRLQVLKALNPAFGGSAGAPDLYAPGPADDQIPSPPAGYPEYLPDQMPSDPYPGTAVFPSPPGDAQFPGPPGYEPAPLQPPPGMGAPEYPAPAPPPRRRGEGWKEDWSE